MKILDPIQKIPGGLMLVPMAIAAGINTFCPQILQIGNPFSAVFSSKGTMCIVGILLVFAGIQTRPAQLLQSLRRSLPGNGSLPRQLRCLRRPLRCRRRFHGSIPVYPSAIRCSPRRSRCTGCLRLPLPERGLFP